jgi:phosphate uptake regulator
MEYRKIIGFGKSSFVVSLPKSWIASNNLKKGSSVSLTEENDKIVISATPIPDSRDGDTSITIDTKGKSDKFLQREIISAYISGYNAIHIRGDDIKEKRKAINDACKNLVALEIIKQDDTAIVAKDFLDITDINLKELIRKIDNNVRSMSHDTIDMLKSKGSGHLSPSNREELLGQIYERDDSINKLSFLCFRSIKDMLMNPSKTRESMIDLFKAWTTVMYLERTGDEMKRLYRNALDIDLTKKEIEEITAAVKEVADIYKNVMRLYHVEEHSHKKTRNYEIAEKCRLFQKKARDRIVSVDAKHQKTAVLYERMSITIAYFEEILRLTYDFL